MESLDWLGHYARLTRHLVETVAQCCSKLPIRRVAELCGLHWNTVRQRDRQRQERQRATLLDAALLRRGHEIGIRNGGETAQSPGLRGQFGQAVIDTIRVDEANRLKHDKKARKVMKPSRWRLLHNAENLKNEVQRVWTAPAPVGNPAL